MDCHGDGQRNGQQSLPWPWVIQDQTLCIVPAHGGRSRSLLAFLTAAFWGMGLLLALVGLQKAAPPLLCLAAGLCLAGAGAFAAARIRPLVLILQRSRREILLCRRRGGRRCFRAFPAHSLLWQVTQEGALWSLSVRPKDRARGQSLPTDTAAQSPMPCHWREGMCLRSTEDLTPLPALLELWLQRGTGIAPGDAQEVEQALRGPLPAVLNAWSSGSMAAPAAGQDAEQNAEDSADFAEDLTDDAPEAQEHLREPRRQYRPPIDRRGELRQSTARPDKKA